MTDSNARDTGRPGIRAVARHAGVAISSVSRVLSDHPSVSDELRARVMSAVDELGYAPDLVARSMRRQETRSIGFGVADISNPLMAEIISGAERALRVAGYSMLLTNSEGDGTRDAAHIGLLERRRVDGLLLSLADEKEPTTLRELERVQVPVVLMDRKVPKRLGVSAVLSDHGVGMRAAVEHLVDLGHRRIGMVVGSNIRPATERVRALKDVFRKRDLPPTYEVRSNSQPTVEFAETATRELLEPRDGSQRCSAIIAGGNQLLLGILQAVEKTDLVIPSRLSIVACDQTAITDLYRPRLATVRRDNTLMGERGARLLLDLIGGENAPRSVQVTTSFDPGQSCAPPPGTA